MRILGVKADKRKGDSTDFVVFKLQDVNYIKMQILKKNSDAVPIYHTAKGTYAPLLTLKDISLSLKNKGFEYADKSTIVNKSRIQTRYKHDLGTNLIFIDGMVVNISKRTKYKTNNQ